jgi:hypothetical protein
MNRREFWEGLDKKVCRFLTPSAQSHEGISAFVPEPFSSCSQPARLSLADNAFPLSRTEIDGWWPPDGTIKATRLTITHNPPGHGTVTSPNQSFCWDPITRLLKDQLFTHLNCCCSWKDKDESAGIHNYTGHSCPIFWTFADWYPKKRYPLSCTFMLDWAEAHLKSVRLSLASRQLATFSVEGVAVFKRTSLIFLPI